MSFKIFLSPPHLEANSQHYLNEAIASNWIAPIGPMLDAWEQDILIVTGRHAVLTTSGSAALELALLLLGTQAGDYVFAATHTCNATINAILHIGAIPVLIDSEPESWNLSAEFLKEAIHDFDKAGNLKRVKALIVVDIYGMPAKMEEISNLTEAYNIPILEDAAEAVGSEYRGKKAGTLGDLGVYSFNGNKIITCGGGGVLLCKTKEQAEWAKFIATQAKDKADWYQHSEIGYTYRMSNILAAIGRGQYELVEKRVARKKEIHESYLSLFHSLGLKDAFIAQKNDHAKTNYWLSVFQIRKELNVDPQSVINQLKQRGIEARRFWKPMHLQLVYRAYSYYGDNVAESLFNLGICFPSGTGMTTNEHNEVLSSLEIILKDEAL